MPEQPEAMLTIGEVAARARHLARDPFAFTERARHWAKLGLLVAADQVGEGSGRHALFPESEAFIAAVVNAFAEAGLQPAGSRPVADAQSMARHALVRWRREKEKGEPDPLFIEIRFYAGGRSDIGVHRGVWKRNSADADARLVERGIDPKARPLTSIKVDLGELFTSVFEAAKSPPAIEGKREGKRSKPLKRGRGDSAE